MEHLRWRNRKRIPSPQKIFAKKNQDFKVLRVIRIAISDRRERFIKKNFKKLSTSRFCFVLFEKCLWEIKFENYLPLKVKSKSKKIDTQTVWKAEKRLKLFPWVVTKSKLFEKRICLIKEKREELEFYLQTTWKVEKRHFKKFLFIVLFVRFMWICFSRSFCVLCVLKCKRCIFSWAPTRFWSKFEIQIWKSVCQGI